MEDANLVIQAVMEDSALMTVLTRHEKQQARMHEYYEKHKDHIIRMKTLRYQANHPQPPPGSRGRPRKIFS